ncbi:MAG: hypothetical protein ACRD1Z_18240 [Vicinamibacteria bacterium]
MNQTPLTTIAPDIFRKRLLIEGFYRREVTHEILEEYFEHVTRELGLRTYGKPIIHRTSGQGKEINEGFDGFVPLIDSGIYIAVSGPRAVSLDDSVHLRPFDERHATALVRSFALAEHQAAIFQGEGDLRAPGRALLVRSGVRSARSSFLTRFND